jgi:phage baseplate assembly protein W
MSTYRGFSSLVYPKKYSLTDFELAQRDLLNYFYIKKGERLMQANFGTIIWGLLFEPLDEHVQQAIRDDITRIVSYDPRLQVGQVAVKQIENGFLIQLTLTYVPTDQTAVLDLNFTQSNATLTTN